MIHPDILEIREHTGVGFDRTLAYGTWRVALAHAAPYDRHPSDLRGWQQHNATDEVFCLLRGSCVLFVAGNGEAPGEIQAVALEPLKLYNVRCGAWHARILGEDSSLIIVENDDTSDVNSRDSAMTEEQHARMDALVLSLGGQS